jgi:soluble lytic murein transglycosylase-like protein
MRTNGRWLMILGVTGAVVAASAGAEPRATWESTRRAREIATYQRGSIAPRLRPTPGDDRAYSREIAEAAGRYAVPERLIWAVIRVESGFNPRAVSRKGARGLMQLMPETAAALGVRDSFDARENIDGGTRHLRSMMVRFRYDVRLAVAAYNAGEKPVTVYRGVPPFPETRDYVAQVLRLYEAPAEWRPTRVREAYRFVQPDGTIVYTNLGVGPLAALAR